MNHGNWLASMEGPDYSTPRHLGHFFLVLRPSAFLPQQAYDEGMRSYLADLRSQPALPGEKVRAPGDVEMECAIARRASGVPIDRETWEALTFMSRQYDLALPV